MLPQWNPIWVEVPVTVDTDAYTANDVVGGTLYCDVPQFKGGGYIHAVRLVDDAKQSEPFYLYAFNAAPSTIADDAAHAPTEADLLKWMGTVEITAADYDTTGADSAAMVKGADRKTSDYVFFDNLANGRLYFRLVAVETPDYADADDLTLHICLMVM